MIAQTTSCDLDWHESIVTVDNHGGCERSYILHESHANERKSCKLLVATLRRQFPMLRMLKNIQDAYFLSEWVI